MLFASWQNFYVIVGSAAGALTGLQFVVIALIIQAKTVGSIREIQAFGTPTVVHFCTALLISALMEVPWRGMEEFVACLGICGAAGLLYSFRIVWHARKSSYNPDLEDWVWYTALPCLGHLTLLMAAVALWQSGAWAMYLVAAASLLFLFVGIHNSWDTVTYIAVKHGNRPADGNLP